MTEVDRFSDGVRSVLPMLYVAWSDAVLSPSEVRLIKKQLLELSFLTKEDKKQILQLGNPQNPPTAAQLHQWLEMIQDGATGLDTPAKFSLVELGLKMAYKGKGNEAKWTNPQTIEGLRNLEKSLKVDSQYSLQELSGKTKDVPTIDVDALYGLLIKNRQPITEEIQNLLLDPFFARENWRIKEDYRAKTLAWCQEFGKRGYGALALPKEYGGEDDIYKYAGLFEQLAFFDHSFTIKYGVQFGLFAGAIYALGSKEQHDKYLEGAGNMQIAGCFAMTETNHGSNVRSLETTATYNPVNDTIVVHTPHEKAGKEYIGNALDSKQAVVFANLVVDGQSHGVHAVVVPLRNEEHKELPGIRVKDNGYKLGLNGIDNGRIWFTNVEVPRSNLLNKYGAINAEGQYESNISNPSKRFFTMLGTLVGGRVFVPRAGLSAAKSALTIAVKYSLKRRQFASGVLPEETILLDYPSHQRRLMPKLARAYAIHFALDELLDKYAAQDDGLARKIETQAAALKSYATWFTTETIQECRETCGGKGYLYENQFADLKADSDIYTTFEGDNTVLMQLVAKGVLTDFRDEFSQDGIFGLVRVLGQRVGTSIMEKNPISIRRTESEHLRSNSFLYEALDYRLKQQIYAVTQRIRGHIKNGLNSKAALLQVQNHLLNLAHAYAEKRVYVAFAKEVQNQKDSKMYPILKMLRNLFALDAIHRDKGYFLEAEYISPAKSKAIRREVEALSKTVRGHAKDLVDAFGIPDHFLTAQIISQTENGVHVQ